MKSPFPGMDPYMEQHWCNVHAGFVVYASGQLNELVPEPYVARINFREVYEFSQADRPDHRRDEAVKQKFIEVKEYRTERVVTVLELLTPYTKRPGPPQELYVQVRQERRNAGISAVEIDILRAGDRCLDLPPHLSTDEVCDTPYSMCVRRAWQPDIREVYPVGLQDRLPTIGFPLSEQEPDALLDLQGPIDRQYYGGRYDITGYSVEPDPPLAPRDRIWADRLLREAGLR